MIEALQFEFMQHAFLAGLLASIICGIMGTLVVINRIVFLSGGIAHAAYGGIGLSFYFGWPYMAGAIGFSTVTALIMATVTLKAKHRTDTLIGVMWAVGMATGILLLDLTPGYNVDLMSYLFGSILTVAISDIWLMLAMCGLICCLMLYFYQDLIAISYDQEFARIRGVPTTLLYIMLILLLAVTIVLLIQIVGLILVIALLTIPPFIMERHSRSLAKMIIGSIILSTLFTICGLWLAYTYNLTSGASIIMVGGVVFFLFLGVEKALFRFNKIS
ncbi:MAG: metal ABC transporter permease [Desulfobacteraceae bacterium]|nr:metal ABC transporter permease [Desulfobacteraceae bacterium]